MCKLVIMTISLPIKEKIKQDALIYARELKIEQTANLHLFTEALEVGQKLRAGPIETEVKVKTAVVLDDLMPMYNWAHPAKVLLYDADKGQLYKTIETHFPPTVMENQPSKVEALSAPVGMIDTLKGKIVKTTPPWIPKTSLVKRYAILFSGNSSFRHLNDLEFLYRTLIDHYGFQPEDIFTLNYNGTLSFQGASNPVINWPGDNTPYRLAGHINGSGTREAMEAALDQIAAKIKSSDLLFIHTNDHGAGPGDGVDDYCLNAYSLGGWSPYYVTDFVNKLKSLPKFDKLMVMMEQCRSGGFVTPIIDNSPANWTHVCAAVRASDYSLGGICFDPFAQDWIAAMTGHYQGDASLTQNVDPDGNSRISATEAFNYANADHHYGDTPTSADKPKDYGAYIFLGLPKNDPIITKRIPSEQVIQLIRRPIPELKKGIVGPIVTSKIQK
jgi:hypothetical protein